MFSDILYTKKSFFSLKYLDFWKVKNWHFLQKVHLVPFLIQKTFSRIQKTLIFESWKISILCKGVSPWFWSKIWSFLTFFVLTVIDQKECLATFLIQKILSRLQKRWYLKGWKFAFFAKGLVHDFGHKVSSPWVLSFKLI